MTENRSVVLPGSGDLSARHRRDHRGARRFAVNSPIVALFVYVAVCVFTARHRAILYDASNYWAGSAVLWNVEEFYQDNTVLWSMRGILVSIVYVPAMLLTKLTSPAWASFSIVLQNSVFLGVLAVYVIPRILRPWVRTTMQLRWAAVLLFLIAFHGFLDSPLMDIWSLGLCLLAIAVLSSSAQRYVWARMVLVGLLVGLAFGFRPAYLYFIVVVGVLALVWYRWRGLFVLLGVTGALVPQVVFNHIKYGVVSATPVSTPFIAQIQAGYGAYITRYDTRFDLPAGTPGVRHFYCSPEMAERVGELPTGVGDLAKLYLAEFPTALVFSLEKIGGSLRWPVSMPYLEFAGGYDRVFGVFITVLAVAGNARIIQLLCRSVAARHSTGRRRSGHRNGRGYVALAALSLGGCLTLAASTPETRFALPLVVVGVAGFLTMPASLSASRLRRQVVPLAIVGVITVAFVVLGYLAMRHPIGGDGELALCLAL